MAGDQFEVATGSVRATAEVLGDRADAARRIAGKAAAADVDTKSWGLLGLSLGLYAGYSAARDSADGSIGAVGSFLTDAKSALEATARDYDAADRAGRALFADIESDLGPS
jgi:hypothetical protein